MATTALGLTLQGSTAPPPLTALALDRANSSSRLTKPIAWAT